MSLVSYRAGRCLGPPHAGAPQFASLRLPSLRTPVTGPLAIERGSAGDSEGRFKPLLRKSGLHQASR